jgi:hypothetical protein
MLLAIRLWTESGGKAVPAVQPHHEVAPEPEAAPPATLTEVHETVRRQRPAPGADPRAVLEFHRRNATLYAQAAKTDSLHKHEAIQYAAIEIREARGIEESLTPHLGEAT